MNRESTTCYELLGDVPFLVEFAMWAVVLLVGVTPIFMLGQAIALHNAQPATANAFHNAVQATIRIAVGLTIWPMLWVGGLELWQRTPTALQDSRDHWVKRLNNAREQAWWL